MKQVIVYHSKYGSTKDYAGWLAATTGAELAPLAQTKRLDLTAYDAVVFGCPFYIGRLKIAGFIKSRAAQLKGRRVAFFAVGGAKPDSPEVQRSYEAALPAEIRAGMSFFYLRGRITLAKMGLLDRFVMRMMKAADYDHTDRAEIAPLVEFLKQ